MSWERGLALGAADEVRRIRNEANANMREAQAIIDRKIGEIARLRNEVASLRHDLTVEKAGNAGSLAKLIAYRSVIDRLSPNYELFKLTGRKYPDGTSEKKSDMLYAAAFDEVIEKSGLKGHFRAVAK